MLAYLGDAKSGSTSELHSSLYRYAQSDVTLAQLRVYVIMHTCIVRPMQTFDLWVSTWWVKFK